MRLLIPAFLSFFAWQCQTSRPSYKKQVTIDLTDKQVWGYLEYSSKKPILYKSVAAGNRHSCGIRDDDTAICWGFNQNGQATAPEGKFKSIAAGDSHSCGIRDNDTAICWGNNGLGQATAPEGKFKSIAAGNWHSCGIRDNDTAICWGLDEDGRASAPKGKFKSIAAGYKHSCGIRDNDTAICWGGSWIDNVFGLGSLGATKVPGIIGRKALICSEAFQEACDFTDGCIWDPREGGGGYCISKHWVACNWVKSRNACIEVGCHWDDKNNCISKSSLCHKAKSADTCNNLPGCSFDRGNCDLKKE
ncbi:MAG: hypothetical protein HYS21_11700 [Deltaproteobacteria bacterium]|nr:hypothetical protein [Deltaproteobacteria bacterium]